MMCRIGGGGRLVVGVTVLTLMAGCMTETHPSTPEREHRKISRPARPAGVRPEMMMLSAGVGTDSDGNTFPDTIPVVVYLFGDTRRYALPLKERGTFEFFLEGPDQSQIGHWIFPPNEVERAAGDSAAGNCYRFALRMVPGRDRMSSRPASLRAIFTVRATDERVFSPGTATIRVGAGN